MFKKYFYFLRKSDWILWLATFFLTAFGLAAIYSIEASAEQPTFSNFQKQLIFFGLGLVFMIFFMMFDYRYLKTYSVVIFVIGLALLLFVLVLGTTVRGTRGWLYFFGVQGFQPVELIKIVMIIIVSNLLSRWRAEIVRLRHLLIVCGCALALLALVLLQPDFGSAIVLGLIFFGMLFLAKVRKSFLISLVIILIAVVILSWIFVLKEYQKERVLTFLDPNRDPYGSGYNIKQSIIAVGSGSLFGRGLSLGSQSRLHFLPAQETDFIFAVIAEELGFIGAALVLSFCLILAYRLLLIVSKANEDFGLFVVYGIIIYFVAQGAMNIAMNLGILPVAGIPLPFVSYGGSSLVASYIAIGIAQGIRIRQIEKTA
jgi:rod shape determining protein RodA